MIDQNSQFYAILTNIGVAKQANADALGIAWKITQMGVGDANGNDPQPDAKQKTLVNEWRRAPLNQLMQDPTNPAIIIAEQVIPAEVGGKWIREIGLYDSDGDLVAVANCAPSFKPLLAQGSGRTQVVRMNLIVSNSASVELKIDPSVVLATREFVTNELARQDFKHSVLAATTASIALSGLQTIDGVAVPAGRRVLVLKQAAARENGIYVTAAGAWARATDADSDARVTPGLLVQVEQGTLNGDSGWQLITDGLVSLGVTPLSFEMAWGRTGIEPGTYRSVTVDKYGRVLAAANPTTVAGYGLTDVYTVAQVDAALGRKANLDSPTFTGTPKAPTPAASTNSEQIATTAFVVSKIAALIGGAPGAMDALNELAAAMGNDPNFAASMTNALALKAPLASPVLTGDPKAPTPPAGDNDASIATTGFTRLCLGLFGIGTDTATSIGDANSIALSGLFRVNADAANIPVVANATLLNMRYNDGGAFQLLAALTGTGGTARLFWRTQAAGGWTAWREVGGLDSPSFTGTPRVPTPETNTMGTQAVNQNYVREWARKFIGAGIAIESGTYKIDPVQAGNWFNVTVPNAVVTLPEAGLNSSGDTFVIRNNAGNASVSIVSSEGILSGVNGKTLVLNPYEIVELVANGTSYWVVDRGLMTPAAALDSPVFVGDPRVPTAPVGDSDASAASTEFVQLALAAFGLGTNIGVYSADLNLATAGGFYRTTSATLNTPVQNNMSVLTSPYNNGGCLQVAALLSGVTARVYFRTQAGGAWSSWREFAGLDSPAFTGKPTAPTAALGTQTDQLATTDFVVRLIGERDVGTVFYSAASAAPRGALKANGAAVSRTTYAALFAAIGTDYGAGDGSTTFNVPDLRGEFVRGLDDGRGIDSGRVRGSAQSDQISSHSHSGTALSAGSHTHTTAYRADRAPPGDGNAVAGDESFYGGDMVTTTSASGVHTHVLSISATGGNEVRPRNVALLACICY